MKQQRKIVNTAQGQWDVTDTDNPILLGKQTRHDAKELRTDIVQGSGNDELLREIKALRAEVGTLRARSAQSLSSRADAATAEVETTERRYLAALQSGSRLDSAEVTRAHQDWSMALMRETHIREQLPDDSETLTPRERFLRRMRRQGEGK